MPPDCVIKRRRCLLYLWSLYSWNVCSNINYCAARCLTKYIHFNKEAASWHHARDEECEDKTMKLYTRQAEAYRYESQDIWFLNNAENKEDSCWQYIESKINFLSSSMSWHCFIALQRMPLCYFTIQFRWKKSEEMMWRRAKQRF